MASQTWFKIVLFTFSANFIVFVECNDENIVNVRITAGLINGETHTSIDGKQFNLFKGIPFAEPPVGELRFKKPIPIKEWPKTYDANKWPNPCHQDRSIFPPDFFHNNNASEDCLYLNIWTPSDSTNTVELKPVIFYIHGGALIFGSSVWKHVTGDIISTIGDVVFVNINYRLGTLGFLYTGTSDAPGNVGLWDQALALEWVNDNIRYFGGDPNRITIMGLSAGSWSASLHILSPVTRNLYRNAILQSGAYTDNLIDGTPEDHIKRWLKAAKLIGCNEEESDKIFDRKIMDCLKNKDPETLSKIPLMPEMKENKLIFFPLVVIDGQFLPKKPSEMLRSGDFKQNVNLMISTAVDEGSFCLQFNYDFKKYGPIDPINLTVSQAFDELNQLSTQMTNKFKINGKEVSELYFTGLSDNDFDLIRRTMGIAIGHYYLACPTILFAKEVFRNTNYKTNIYQYLWNIKSPDPTRTKWFGPSHGEDLMPSHGIPFIEHDKYSDEFRDLSKKIITFLTDFARNDEPTQQSGTRWPKYFSIDDNIIAPFYELTENPLPETNFKIGLKINECEYLWEK